MKRLCCVTFFLCGFILVDAHFAWAQQAQENKASASPAKIEKLKVDPSMIPLPPPESELGGEKVPAEKTISLDTGGYEFDNNEENKPIADGAASSEGDVTETEKVLDKSEGLAESVLSDGAFFDADAILPEGRIGKQGPAPVNPKSNPASKLVIVEDVTKADSVSSRLIAAERALSLGLHESALGIYEDLYKKNKKDPRVLMGKAVVLQKMSRYEESLSVYEELDKLQPNNLEVKINMLGVLAKRYPAVALRRLMELNEQNPQNIGIVSQIAVTAGNTGDYETALRYLGVAIGMQPDKAHHIYNAAIIMDRAGRAKEAVSYYEKALEVDSVYGGGRTLPRDAIYERLAVLR